MEALLEEIEVNIGQTGLEAFHRFAHLIPQNNNYDPRYQVATVKISSYADGKIHQFRTTILLINQGLNAGRIWIDDGEEGFSEENVLLCSRNRQYSLGRTGRELIVEVPRGESHIHRVELEC